jgi:hypothetical protein
LDTRSLVDEKVRVGFLEAGGDGDHGSAPRRYPAALDGWA